MTQSITPHPNANLHTTLSADSNASRKATLLQFDYLSCGYHQNHPLINQFSATIEAECIIAILGLNGSGKSTLLKTMMGLEPPLSGHFSHQAPMAFVPQEFIITFDYQVLDIVLMGRAQHFGLFGKPTAEDRQLAYESLCYLQIESLATRYLRTLSGGQKQLVLLARAMSSGAKILLLDEPTSALDLHNQKRVLEILEQLAKEEGFTILFTTHNPQHALKIADQTIIVQAEQTLIGETNALLTETRLTDLYRLPMHRITINSAQEQCENIVPIF